MNSLLKTSPILLLTVALVSWGTAGRAWADGDVLLSVREPSGVVRSAWPVTSGVPLPRGAVRKPDQVALFTSEHHSIPLQTEVLSRWPDGSIRWLLLDFLIDLQAGQTRRLRIRYGSSVRRAAVPNPIGLQRSAERWELRTGPLRVQFSKDRFRLLDAVWLDRNRDGRFAATERLTSGEGAGVYLTTPDGEVFRADLGEARWTVEQKGPVRACIRIAGDHLSKQGKRFRYVVRIHAYRGQPYLKFHYTFVNDHREQLMSDVRSLELRFVAAKSRRSQTLIGGHPTATGPTRLFQVDDRRYEINRKPAGKRAAGWAGLASDQGGFAVGVRHFWQNWPKSLEAAGGHLRVGLCPHFPAGTYDNRPIKEEAKLYYYLRGGRYSFKIGVARTHELWVRFFSQARDKAELTDFFRAAEDPLLAQAAPQYVGSTRAMGDFPPANPRRYCRYDAWLDSLFRLHLDDREAVREYGMLNFGDWYNIRWDSWGNLEYDTARCFLVQYLRTGDRRYFDRGSEAALHYLDVDVLHEASKKLHAFPGSAKMQPGHVWLHQVGHTGGYYGRYDGTRYHGEAPLVMKGPYQVGMYNYGHQWIGGVFDYYLLTGDRRALAVARKTADTIAANCPTRYTDHIRDVGWPLNLVIAAYEATGEKRYLDAATRQWKLLQKHLDPQRGWHIRMAYGHCSEPSPAKRCRGHCAYMLGLTLSGLARYHRATQDPAVQQALTAGVKQLIRECWSEKHKSFYLTSCTHLRGNPPPALCSVTSLASEAIAYEARLTNNREHLRILRAAFRTLVDAGLQSVAKGEPHGQTGYASMMFHFAPYALSALEDD